MRMLSILFLVWASPTLAADRMEMGFVLSWGPFEIARLHYSMTWDDTSYEIKGRGNTTGLVGLVVDWGGSTTTTGIRDEGGQLFPKIHQHEGNLGGSQRYAEVIFKDNMVLDWNVTPSHAELEQTEIPLPLPSHLIDPLTLIGRLTLGLTPFKNCNLNQLLFDGRRLAQISFAPPEEGSGCALKSEKLGGFRKKDDEKDPRGRFQSVQLNAVGDIFVPTEFGLKAPLGNIVAQRYYLNRSKSE